MLRAVIYARCSTEEESQKDALINQVQEAKACVKAKGWTLIDSYVESRSGTTTKGRNEYNRLYDDMSIDKFDVIVIKSQDRLMRNTKDWYLFVDRLSTEGKKLYIYIEGKFYTTDDALITGIKAILAEDYSRELSKKINNAHRNRQKNNGTVIITNNAYGFQKLADKSVILDEEEARVKRRMYELCAAGFGSRTISTILKNEGILNRNGNPFNSSSVLRIIHNPINMGTVVMNRKHYDFDSKQTYRVPEAEQYVYKDKVPPTVSEELWHAANNQIANRVSKKKRKYSEERIGKYSGLSILSGKIVCGYCGSTYYRRNRRRYKNGEIIRFWACKRYFEEGRNEGNMDRPQIRKAKLEHIDGCDNIHLDEEKFYRVLEQVLKEHYSVDKESIISEMLLLLKTVFQEKDVSSALEKEKKIKQQIEKQMLALVDKLLNNVITDTIYQAKHKELEDKMQLCEEQIKKLENQGNQGNLLRQRIQQIEERLRDGNLIDKATVEGMLEEIDKILIFPTYMEIHFDLSRVLGMQDVFKLDEGNAHILRYDYGNEFQYLKKKQEDRQIIVEMMRNTPCITAKIIAEKLGISLSGANYKIKALKREGKIKYEGKGGHGIWLVNDDEGV